MSAITTHVLDTVLGGPGAGISVRLDMREDEGWKTIGSGSTDDDGRCRNLAANAEPGVYRLTFGTGAYMARLNRKSIYPEISITFQCGANEHYHLPLLVSDNSYTSYRGS